MPVHHTLWTLWLLVLRLAIGCEKDEQNEAILLVLLY